MSIDWFTVFAQIINFLVLLWLLKRFLYQPVLDALDARERRIAKTLSDAAAKEKQAQQERDLFLHKNQQFERQSKKLLESATKAANKEAQHLLESARQVAADLCLQQQATFQRQQQSLCEGLTQKTQQEVFAITRQTLKDLGDAGLEEQILKVFLIRLGELDENDKAIFISALSKNNSVRVRTTFVLQAIQQQAFTKALHESFAAKVQISFENDADVVCGIELYIDGHKLAWSMSQYIDSLELHFQQLVRDSVLHPAGKQGNDDELLTAEPGSLSVSLTAEKRNSAND
ncbi:F0F1 ATP synthase subunit B [Psychromonas sp.]|uniref:F0F1 ATP synthase subunit B family protein n=1 Tax=Psychromonas sp. TaxID=1884585 RepID=UPI003566CE6B